MKNQEPYAIVLAVVFFAIVASLILFLATALLGLCAGVAVNVFRAVTGL